MNNSFKKLTFLVQVLNTSNAVICVNVNKARNLIYIKSTKPYLH